MLDLYVKCLFAVGVRTPSGAGGRLKKANHSRAEGEASANGSDDDDDEDGDDEVDYDVVHYNVVLNPRRKFWMALLWGAYLLRWDTVMFVWWMNGDGGGDGGSNIREATLRPAMILIIV